MPDPYSRLYWRFLDEYPDVYDDDRALACWMRLLVIAEGAHPALPVVPRKTKSATLTVLVDAGLVTLLPGDRYRIKGLAKERDRRSEQGRKGGLASGERRTNVEPSLNDRSTGVEPSKAEQEQSKDETRTQRAIPPIPVKGMNGVVTEVTIGDNPDIGRLQKLAEELTGQAYVMVNIHSGFGLKAVTEQLPHGFDRVEKAWRQIANRMKAEGTSLPTMRQLVFGADEYLNPVPRRDEKEARAEDEQAAFNRRVARTHDYIETLRAPAKGEDAA